MSEASQAAAAYRRLVEEANSMPIIVRSDVEYTDGLDTWWQITQRESEAFKIDPALVHALAWAHLRYEVMIGLADNEAFLPFIAQERVEFSQFFSEAGRYSVDGAVGFMVTACGLSYAQAIAWVCRGQIQRIRSQLLEDGIDSPLWARGRVVFKQGEV